MIAPALLLRPVYRIGYRIMQVYWRITHAHKRGVKCLILHEDEVLLVRHTYGDRRRWDLPGGSIKGGEQPIETAHREVREELGLTIGRWTPLGELAFRRMEGCRDTIYGFRGRVGELTLRIDEAEIAQARWFACGHLPVGVGFVTERWLAVSDGVGEDAQ